MQFSLIREYRNNYFPSPYLLQEAVFLKGELASMARYHYSFWSRAFSTLITFYRLLNFTTVFSSMAVAGFETQSMDWVCMAEAKKCEVFWSFPVGVECRPSHWNSLFKSSYCLKSRVRIVAVGLKLPHSSPLMGTEYILSLVFTKITRSKMYKVSCEISRNV